MKVSIVIPVYNEAKTVEELVRRVQKVELKANKEVIIVESNSSDGSRDIVKQFEKNPFTKVFYEDKPSGKGSAVTLGLKHATGDIVIIQDADLEYDVNDYGKLIKPIMERKAEFVLGSRCLKKGHWKIRSLKGEPMSSYILNYGGVVFNILFRLLYGVHMTDIATMFKVFSRNSIKGIKFNAKKFDFDIELLSKLLKKGIKPIEVPVSYKARSYEDGKKVRMVRDGWNVFWATIRYRFAD